jgi:hypothetical protein
MSSNNADTQDVDLSKVREPSQILPYVFLSGSGTASYVLLAR